MLTVRLLGQFDLRLGDKPAEIPSRLAQSLLAYLLLNSGTAHRREKLAGLLWPEVPDEAARRNLRQALWHIRRAIETEGQQYIRADDITVKFDPDSPHWLDVSILEMEYTFEQDSLEALCSAAAVYKGDLLPGFYDEWAILERERLHAIFEQKMGLLLDRLVANQRWDDVLYWAENWIALGQAPEPAYRALMIAWSAKQDLSSVGMAFRRCQEALQRELGIAPSSETLCVWEKLTTGAPLYGSTQFPSPTSIPSSEQIDENQNSLEPAAGEAPFKGLQFFEEADADLFFGREALITRLISRLITPEKFGAKEDAALEPSSQNPSSNTLAGLENILAIVGASGSGKSSLVRAGMIPALRRNLQTNHAASYPAQGTVQPLLLITPTAHPLAALANGLIDAAESQGPAVELIHELAQNPFGLQQFIRQNFAALILVVDQFEELFTLCQSETERQAFVDNLLNAAQSGCTTLILTLRADFYAHCAQYYGLRQVLAARQEFIGPMSAEELRQAIEQPAFERGWSFEPGLVDLLLHDTGNEPGALPLLSHALLETWNRRRGRRLTFQGYAESNGVQGAIAKTAESVYNHQLSPEQQILARRIFLRLTQPGEGTEDTRRRVTLAEFTPYPGEEPAIEAVLSLLAAARLITLTDKAAEVAHEALIREWPTLRRWLSEDRDGLRQHRRLTEAAQAWDSLQRDPGELYRGARLAQTLEWAVNHRAEMNPLEQLFLDRSQEWSDRETAEREAQRRRELESAQKLAVVEAARAAEQRRTNRRLRGLAFALGVFLLAALLLAGLAALQQRRARLQANLATSRELAAAAINDLQVDAERSLLLALQAENTADTLQAQEAIHQALLASRILRSIHLDIDASGYSAFNPDGSLFALTGKNSKGNPQTEIWETATGLRRLVLPGYLAARNWPHANRMATIDAGDGDTTRLTFWEIPSGKPVATLSLAFRFADSTTSSLTPNWSKLVVAMQDGGLHLWDLSTDSPSLNLEKSENRPSLALAISPDGNSLITTDQDHLRVWDLTTGQFRSLVTLYNNYLIDISASPDGKHVAYSDLGVANFIEGAIGKESIPYNEKLPLPYSQTGYVWKLAYDPTGSRLVTAANNGMVKIWDPTRRKVLLSLPGHVGGVLGVSFSPDGVLLATIGSDHTLRFWDTSFYGNHEWLTIAQPDFTGFTSLAIDPDGSTMATTGEDGAASLWDLKNGIQLWSAREATGVHGAVAYSPDRKSIAFTNEEKIVNILDASQGNILQTLIGHTGMVGDLAFSPDGKQIATISYDRTTKLWDVNSGQVLWSTSVYTDTHLDISKIHFPLYNNVMDLAYSPDGTRLVMTDGKSATILDPSTRQVRLRLPQQENLTDAVAFSPDGKSLAIGTLGGAAGVWDAQTGQPNIYLSGHTGSVRKLAFSPDGKRLATASNDNLVKIWDTATGQELLTLPNHTDEITGVAFTPDGTRLVTTSLDGTLRVYAMQVPDLIALARSRLTRSLRTDECKKYLHLESCPVSP